MKHIVKLTLSNPSHEHVSLRSRTKQQNYISEGRDESEAINRAERHFRSLGYKIHSATIVEQKKEVPAAPAVLKEEAEQVDEVNSRYDMTQALTPKSSNVKAAVGTTARDKAATNKYARRISKLTGGEYSKQDVKDHLKSLANEETSYIEEKLSVSDGVDKWIHDFVHSDNPKFEGKSKKERIQQALGAYYAAKRGTNEEVEQVEEGSMSPAVKAAQAKFDAQTKAQQQKPVQAGTLAAKARREGQVAEGAEDLSNILGVIKAAAKSKTLAKQASPKIELGLSKDNPVNEKGPKDEDITEAVEAEEKETKSEVKNKEVKSTEKETEVAKAKNENVKKKKNPVILNPTSNAASVSISAPALGGSTGTA